MLNALGLPMHQAASATAALHLLASKDHFASEYNALSLHQPPPELDTECPTMHTHLMPGS